MKHFALLIRDCYGRHPRVKVRTGIRSNIAHQLVGVVPIYGRKYPIAVVILNTGDQLALVIWSLDGGNKVELLPSTAAFGIGASVPHGSSDGLN